MVITNSLIYIHVRASSRRVHPLAANENNITIQNRRDIYILKHTLFIFILFIIGWSPIEIVLLLDLLAKVNM